MPYNVTITAEAETHLQSLTVRERRIVEHAVLTRLRDQPTTPTRAIKRLRPNPLVEFELRIGDLRVLYNVEGTEVVLLVVGRKVGSRLVVKGEDFHGHQDHPSEPPGGGPARDAG